MPRTSPIWGGSRFYFVFFGALAVWLPFLAVYFHRLGLSGPEIGLLSALQPAAGFLMAAPIATQADRRGWHLRLLSGFALGLAASMLLLMLTKQFLVLLPVMALMATFYSPIIPLADSTTAAMATRYHVGYGSMRLWGSLSYALSAPICGYLWLHFGYPTMFPVAAGLYALLAWFSRGLEEVEREPPKERRLPVRTIIGNRFLLLLLISTFIVGAALGVDMTFTGIYMTHLGGGAELVGLMFGLSAMFELPAMRWSAPLVRRIGGPYALLIAYGCFATAYLGYAISPSPLVMIGFSVFRGLAFGLFYASTVHLVHEMAPKQWSSTLQAVMNALAFGLAQLISRPGSGAIYDSFGPSAAFVAAGGAVLVAMLIMGSTAIFTRRPSRPALSPAEPGM